MIHEYTHLEDFVEAIPIYCQEVMQTLSREAPAKPHNLGNGP